MKMYITAKEARENTNNAIKRLKDDAIMHIFETIRQKSSEGKDSCNYFILEQLSDKNWIEEIKKLLESKGYKVTIILPDGFSISW